jgi:hypothetical protein
MTACPTVRPDGRWSALRGCGCSLTSMRQYYPTRRTPPMARSTHSRMSCGGRVVRRTRARGQCHARGRHERPLPAPRERS